ncbi:class I SAM-dependent methyltransferase [Thiohalobacter thiocyanaticus]|uniref:SAM-dependent methyltransferase n=1 Tax=Thiohalobacter thiocyanaticus TaxID=585455 RepID=A0A426QJ14_9GAMM|nr:SAM-dependent methyltransferase [Thiohalobacter thiocyanaticus]RRQ21762.1 SAM-dependent methyltransferase [Thiohalobacter thiocyanaticus]
MPGSEPPSPWAIPADWPAPAPEALAVSERLVEVLRARMQAAGGSLPFADYMHSVLYEPGLGYYSAGARKFGAAGDFVTGPELSPLFSQCVAVSCAAVLEALNHGAVLELGAGSGALAVEVLRSLQAMDRLPESYLILEPSADLRERQRQRLNEEAPALLERVTWLDRPPERFAGMVIANEVLDALPVELFHWDGTDVWLRRVQWEQAGFGWTDQPADAGLAEQVRRLAEQYDWPPDYSSERAAWLSGWLSELAASLTQGAMLFIDYGYPRGEYYHPQRGAGTLMCHYRHRAHPDPLRLPGLQDITAHVDFTAVAEAASAAGLRVAGFTDQAHYLIDAGIEDTMAAAAGADPVAGMRLAQQVRQLMLPGEMGERFKAMLLTRDCDAVVPGFRQQDLRNRL